MFHACISITLHVLEDFGCIEADSFVTLFGIFPFDSFLHVKSTAAIIKMPNDENIPFCGSNFHGNEKRNEKGDMHLMFVCLSLGT